MTKTRVEFNQSYFDNFMRTGPVEALVEARADAVLATAKATAPVDTGAYRDSIAVHKRAGQYRGNEVPFSSKHQFNVDGRYRLNQDWTYALDGLFVSKAFTDTANTKDENAIASVGQLPSYWVWNTSLERRFRFSGDELTTSIGISNLFDNRYYFRGMDTSPWGRQSAPGRTVKVAANYRF